MKVAGTFDPPEPKPGQHIYRGGLSGEDIATITQVLGPYGDGWSVETSPNIEAIPGDGVVVYYSGTASSVPYWRTDSR